MSAEAQYQLDDNQPATITDDESAARAGTYGLLAALLRSPPDQALLGNLAGLKVEDTNDDFSRALVSLRMASRRMSAEEIRDEYQALFIGLGRGEVVPYASWYLTGFLMERPLGELRRDLEDLGFHRQEGVHEPEDHLAAISEVISMIIGDDPDDIDGQRSFFDKHFGCWAGRFFSDLEQADSAVFYRAVAGFGAAFTALEQRFLTQEV